MICIKGQISGNTVIARDECLREFDGKEILVQLPDLERQGGKNIAEVLAALDGLCRQGMFEWTENPAAYIRKERDDDLR